MESADGKMPRRIMAAMFAVLALVSGLENIEVPFLVITDSASSSRSSVPTRQLSSTPRRSSPGACVRTTGHGIAAAIGKLGGFLGVFLFPFLMSWKGLLGAESAAAISSVLGLIVTIACLPETKGRSLEAI